VKPVIVLVHETSNSAHAYEYEVGSFADIRPEHFSKACILKAMDGEATMPSSYVKVVIWRDGLGSWLETRGILVIRIVLEDV
jgi:hypothetical protein